jgi:hypothetical protein
LTKQVRQCSTLANSTTNLQGHQITTTLLIKLLLISGSPAQITLGYTPDIGEVVRFAASGMIGDNDVVIDYDYVGTNVGKPNFYAFRLLLNHTTVGVPGTINLGEWGYSFTTKTNGTLSSTLTPASQDRFIGNHSHLALFTPNRLSGPWIVSNCNAKFSMRQTRFKLSVTNFTPSEEKDSAIFKTIHIR